VAARFDARPLQKLGGEVMWKCFPGDDRGSSPGNEGRELPPTRVGCRRPSPHKRVSRLRGRSFNCDFGVACKVSRLARGAISYSARPAAPASGNLRRMGCLGCTRLTVSVKLDAPFQKKGVRRRAAGAAGELVPAVRGGISEETPGTARPPPGEQPSNRPRSVGVEPGTGPFRRASLRPGSSRDGTLARPGRSWLGRAGATTGPARCASSGRSWARPRYTLASSMSPRAARTRVRQD
jgi:hypothetical protein